MTFNPYASDEVKQGRTRNDEFPLISIQEVAKQYGKSVRTLRRWEAAGLMPPRTKHGHRMKYNKTDIALMMAAR